MQFLPIFGIFCLKLLATNSKETNIRKKQFCPKVVPLVMPFFGFSRTFFVFVFYFFLPKITQIYRNCVECKKKIISENYENIPNTGDTKSLDVCGQ